MKFMLFWKKSKGGKSANGKTIPSSNPPWQMALDKKPEQISGEDTADSLFSRIQAIISSTSKSLHESTALRESTGNMPRSSSVSHSKDFSWTVSSLRSASERIESLPGSVFHSHPSSFDQDISRRIAIKYPHEAALCYKA